jgi:hypothetical protein
MVALLLDDDPAVAPAPAVAAVTASPAHLLRVRDCLSLTREQQRQLRGLWQGVQAAHSTCASKRQALLIALQQQYALTGAWQGVARYGSCHAGQAAAAVMDQLLGDVDNSMAADYGVLMEASRLLWGDQVRVCDMRVRVCDRRVVFAQYNVCQH